LLFVVIVIFVQLTFLDNILCVKLNSTFWVLDRFKQFYPNFICI